MASCPECSVEMSVGESAQVNEIVQCPSCMSELEVVSTVPAALALAPEPEEDWGE